jgi:SAM-dependent methyltransferase
MKYLIFRIFRFLLEPFSTAMRKRRMALFESLMKPTSGMKILDLGGQPKIWDSIKAPLNITCLNLPGIATTEHSSHHNIAYVEGDACDMPYFKMGDFDLVFSNSVIEHVGDYEKQLQFTREIRRLSDTFWVQTPFKYFPIEAHCGMPFWWFYPQGVRTFFLRRWKKILPGWGEMVETTSVISPEELRTFLPTCEIRYEWLVVPKSLIACSTKSSKTSGAHLNLNNS